MKSELTEHQISLSFKSKEEVLTEVEKNKKYYCNQASYKMYLMPYIPEGKGANQHFLIDFTYNFRYVGAISREFHREFFGANYYNQQDIYIGEWKNDQRHGYGMYFFNNSKPKSESSDKSIIYFGQYSKGEKEGKGLLIWKNTKNLNSRLIDESFTAFLGSFTEGKMVSGVFYSQIKTQSKFNQLAYMGKFENDKRQDSSGTIIDLTNNQLCFGNYDNDINTRGFIVQFLTKATGPMINDVFYFDSQSQEQFVSYDKIEKTQRDNVERQAKAIIDDFNSKQYWNRIDAYYHKMLFLANECQCLEAYKNRNLENLNFISELKSFEEI